MFLKRAQYPGITMDIIYVGAVLTIYSRQLKVVDYGDVYTRKFYESRRSRTLAMIKPDAYEHMGKILDAIYKAGFTVNRLKMVKLTLEQSETFYGEHKGKPFFTELTTHMSSDVIVAIELISENAVQRWRELIGPTNLAVAREKAPTSLRARFGKEGSQNAVHGSDSSKPCL